MEKTLTIGRYKVKSFLGRGGMAEAFKCQLSGLGGFDKVVVVKRILPELANDPEFIKMFFDEARLAAQLNHPNIVQVFEVDHEGGLPFITMEYVYGPTMRQVLSQVGRGKPIPLNHAVRIVSDVCLGLDHAHKAKDQDGNALGIVHRDVSPHNVIVSMEGTAKLLDFGVAKAHGKLSTTRVGAVKGKFAYMAPEQAGDEVADHRADVFAAGICLYRASTGRVPFSGKNEAEALAAILEGRYKKPSEVVPDYPPELEDIIRTALERDRDKRYDSARALHDALQDFATAAEINASSQSLSSFLATLYPDANESTFDSFEKPKLDQYYVSKPGSGTGSLSGLTPSSQSVTLTPSNMQQVMVSSVYPGQQRSPWFVVAIALGAALATIALGTIAVMFLRGEGDEAAGSEVADRLDQKSADNLRSYLDEAERLAEEEKYAIALEVLEKARQVETTDSALNLRMARTTDAVEKAAFLAMASQALERGDKTSAVEHAKKVLDRDFENETALAILQKATERPAEPEGVPAEEEPAEEEVEAVEDEEDSKKASARKKKTRRASRRRGKAAADDGKVQNGQLSVKTDPPAMVYVDDRPLGRAPVSEMNLKPGVYTVEVRAQGYEVERRIVEIDSAETNTLSFSLRAVPEKPLAAATVAMKTDTSKSVGAKGTGMTEPKPAAPTPTVQPPPTPPKPQPDPPKTDTRREATPKVQPKKTEVKPKEKRERPPIAAPSLPSTFQASSAKQIVEAFRKVESETMRAGRMRASVARNITVPLAKAIIANFKPGQSVTIYPSSMYYFVIDKAYDGRSRSQIASALKRAHFSGSIKGYRPAK